MNTPAEWFKEFERQGEDKNSPIHSIPANDENFFAYMCMQIQLDAVKEGMRRAANDVCKTVIDTSVFEETISAVKYTQQTILAAADQLTEKDLCPSTASNPQA